MLDRTATADRARPADDADTLEQLSISKKADVALKMKRREVLAFGLEVQQGKYHLVEQCQPTAWRRFMR